MPDICMCDGKECPLKESCYRYKAVPSEYRQSYFANPPYDKEKESCDYYVPTENDPKPEGSVK